MTAIAKINRVYTRTYSDTKQTKIYVEWTDTRGRTGRTEGDTPAGAHMQALIDRGAREGVAHETETW